MRMGVHPPADPAAGGQKAARDQGRVPGLATSVMVGPDGGRGAMGVGMWVSLFSGSGMAVLVSSSVVRS